MTVAPDQPGEPPARKGWAVGITLAAAKGCGGVKPRREPRGSHGVGVLPLPLPSITPGLDIGNNSITFFVRRVVCEDLVGHPKHSPLTDLIADRVPHRCIQVPGRKMVDCSPGGEV